LFCFDDFNEGAYLTKVNLP